MRTHCALKQAKTEKTKSTDRARAQRHKARLKYLEDGSITGKIQYYAGEGVEVVRSNPIAAVMTILAIIVASIYACCKACCSDDYDEDAVPENADETVAATEEKELQATTAEGKEAGAGEGDKEETSEGDKEETSETDQADDDVPPSIDTNKTDKKSKKTSKKKKKRSEKERE